MVPAMVEFMGPVLLPRHALSLQRSCPPQVVSLYEWAGDMVDIEEQRRIV